MKQYLISHICLLMLFVTCNVSINAKSAEDGFRKANYCFKGAGKKTVHGLQSGYFDNIVVDVLVKPRSVKKRCSIAEQTDGQNGYRLIQDGKNVVFEVAIAGTFHKVTATDVFERGESIYLSGYYKDGYAGILVNGKVPVNKVFQINSDKLERLNSNSSENNIINNLSSVDGEVFNSLSDFKKTLKKCIGRRAYKKYGDEIVQLAGRELKQSSVRCFVGEPGLFAKVPMVVGLNFSGAIEQVRIWQPVNPRIKVAACENLRQEYEATAVVANSGKAVVKSCREEVEKTRQVALLENVNLRCSKSLSCCVGFKNQQAEPISKTNKAATVAEVKCKSDQHKCQTALPQNSNYVALVDSGLLSDMCNLTEANNASENREGVLELGAKCYNKQLFQNQSCNSIGSRDAQSFMGAQSEEANGLSRALKGWDFKAVNYDNTHLGDFQLKSLLGNETYNGWENAVNKTDELKIGFGIFSCLLTEVKRNELWDETARTLENQFLVYIDNYVLEASDDYHAQKARTSKRSESEKLTFLKNSTNSELANVLKDDFKKCLELKSGASKLLITSPDAVNYVRCENQVLKLYSLLKHENLKWEQGSNLHSEVQNSLFQNGTIASGKRIRNGSVWLIRYYHNESDLLSLHTSDLRMGHKFSNYHLWQNHVTTDNICLATSFLVDDEGDRWIRDSSGPELEDGRFFQMDGAPCDSRRSFEVQGWEEEEWTWGIKAYAYICDPHLSSNMINRSHWQTAGLVDHYNEPDRSDGHMLHRSYVIKSIFGYGYEIEPSPPPV